MSLMQNTASKNTGSRETRIYCTVMGVWMALLLLYGLLGLVGVYR
jgi:hypothetical protein